MEPSGRSTLLKLMGGSSYFGVVTVNGLLAGPS